MAKEEKRLTSSNSNVPETSGDTREKWKKKIDFAFSLAGGFVGLGNVWRFPYLCYKNGGGAFLIPYILFVLMGSLPVFFLEVAIGQYTSMGSSLAFNCVPLMKGIGLAVNIINFHLNTYYAVILAWSARYFFASMSSELPWATCANPFNTKHCFVFGTETNETIVNRTLAAASPEQRQAFTWASGNSTQLAGGNTSTFNATAFMNFFNVTPRSSVIEFWEHGVLRKSSGLGEVGSVQWELLLCLLLTWIVMYFCIWRGIGWTSKVVYFTATFPLALLIVLLVRGCTLDGALDGIVFYLKPDLEKLKNTQVWLDAANQVFFSYALCKGMIITMGSYNGYKYNSYRDCILLSCLNSGVSFIAGFAIFSVLGFMAKEQGVNIKQVAESGPGLAFIAYPKALALMPMPQLWGCLFFFMLFLLGLDSEFVGLETLIAAFVDLYPAWFKRPWRRELVLALLCFVQFVVGISMITNGGIYVFHIFDNYAAAGWCLLFLGMCECVAMSWCFGIDRFYAGVCDMIGFVPAVPFFKWSWAVVTPLSTSVLMIVSLAFYKRLRYQDYVYPDWSLAVCWSLTMSSILWVPGYAIYYYVFQTKGDFKQRWQQCLTSQNDTAKCLPEDSRDSMEMEPFYNGSSDDQGGDKGAEGGGELENHQQQQISPPKYEDVHRHV